MNLVRWLVAFWVASCTSLFAHQVQSDTCVYKRPNIVVLIADDLGWGDISLHKGTVGTPNIDRLAQDGVEFERYYTYPLCSPARAALLTGMMPKRYGITRALGPREPGLPAGLPTLPKTLQSAGYQTWMVGKWHIGTASPPRKTGFEHFYGFLGPEIDYFQHTGRGGVVDWQRNEQTINESGYSTHLIAAEAKRLLKERDSLRPFYLQVAFNAPHFPLAVLAENSAKHSHLAPAAATRAGVIDALDIAIGDVLTTLNELSIAEDTLVVFLSDNGADQSGSNAPYRGAKFSVFEGGIHVPCFMRWPKQIKAHTSSKQAVTAHDLYPTLLGAAGVTQTDATSVQALDGINLWPSISNDKLIERDPFVIAADNTAIFDGDWKLVETSTGLIGLYNLANDPGETLDLSFRETEHVKNLQSKLELVKSQFPATNVRARPPRRR